MDKARKQTDKKLNKMEKDIGRIYKDDPALKSIEKAFAKYMIMVKKKTQASYKAYVDEYDWDKRAELKKVYSDEVKALTMDSPEYRKLVKDFTATLSYVNQKALNISNKAMNEIYAINYNQVAEECKRVGIKVNGKKFKVSSR